MTLWLILGALALITAGVLAVPLIRGRAELEEPGRQDLAVYRDQLAEVDRDVERGLLSEKEAADARTEISRRILAAGGGEETADAGTGGRPRRRAAPALAVAVAAVVVAGAFGVYLPLGSPDQPSAPFAERARDTRVADGGMGIDIEEGIKRLAARLKERPDDLDGWILLGRSYITTGRFESGIAAFRHALDLAPENVELRSALAEAMTMGSNGIVTPAARQEFETVLAKDPGDPRARFYLGIAEAQAGRVRSALDRLLALEKDSAPDAPWLPALREHIERIAADADIDLDELAPRRGTATASAGAGGGSNGGAAAPGPSAADVKAAQEMTEAERIEFIRSMVGRLAARLEDNPDDVQGWIRLARSYSVLGEKTKSRTAYARAAELAPDDAAVLAAYADSILAESGPQAMGSAEFMRIMRTLLALDPNNRVALWHVGQAEYAAGNRTAAAAYWRRLLAQLAPESADYARVKARLDALKGS